MSDRCLSIDLLKGYIHNLHVYEKEISKYIWEIKETNKDDLLGFNCLYTGSEDLPLFVMKT